MKRLEHLGYSSWFQARADNDKLSKHELARVVSVHRDSYLVNKGTDDVFAVLAGKLTYSANSPAELPTTGDWVYVDFHDNDNHAIIHDVLPRRSSIKRKSSGKTIDFQLIAANVDVAFIVQSVDYNFNLSRLERYLVMVNENNITPIILLSKCDLKSPRELDQLIEGVVTISPQTTVLPFSNLSHVNIDTIMNMLSHGYTYCLLGSSGVGKTTLLNRMLGSTRFDTKSVSDKNSKGRHTTTSRELVQIECGAILIDTPGMRELGNMAVDAGIDETFAEIVALSLSCRFSDCSHTSEKGCAILSAIQQGMLSEKRYRNYLKVKSESNYNEMSYFEKRQKDRNLGKLIKSVVKHKREKHQ